jgi:hypothetical protein
LHGYSGDFGHLIRRKSARYRSEATLVIELQYDIVETKKDKTHMSQERDPFGTAESGLIFSVSSGNCESKKNPVNPACPVKYIEDKGRSEFNRGLKVVGI